MNELPKRKRLRLKYYDYSKNGYYFITICTHNRQEIFERSTVGDDLCIVSSHFLPNQIIEKWLLKLQTQFGVLIDYYIFMPDHIHFILIIDSERHMGRSLPDMMQWFKTMTTNEYIKMVKNNILKPFDKKLWQKSYFEHIIRDENDYITRINYILNNPFKYDVSE